MTAGEFYQTVGYELAGPPPAAPSLRYNARALSGVDDGYQAPQAGPEMGTDEHGVISYETPGRGQNGESSN